MIYQQLRQKLTKLTRFNRKQRRQRVSRFEQLEVRHMLAAAVWTNVLQPLDVSNNDGAVSPLDALLVINELNLSVYTGRNKPLPLEIPDSLHPAFIDVTCDGFVSPIDALLVVNRLNNRSGAPLSSPSVGQPTWQFQTSENTSTAGKYLFNTCSPQLVEGSSYASQLSTHVTLPDSTTAIQVKFDTPVFDRSSQQSIRDAFEILVLDDAGQSLVLPYSPGRDAAFNWSEGLSPTGGPAAQYASGVATINLSGIAAGTSVHVVARLDNNDVDNNSSVIIRSINFVDSQIATPTSYSPLVQNALTATAPELSQLVDVSGSLIANYGATSISKSDNSVLSTQLSVANAGNFTVTGQLIAAIDGISEPDVHVLRPDGYLQDGRPYLDLTSQLNGGGLAPGLASGLAPGQTVGPREVNFQNLGGKRFGFHVTLLSKVASAPTQFTSVPLNSVEAGDRYRYVASAQEPTQSALQYSIVSGPESLTITPASGEINWQTKLDDVGNHSVTVRATNQFGLSLDQEFTIGVVQSLQNRPPVFTSTPATEATAASGFEVLTLATGKNPTGLAAGDFGSGNISLVAINAGDQSLSYLNGLGSDNFASPTTVSVGEPRPTGSVIRSSVGVDLGLSPYINPSDKNQIDAFATADFDGDGQLDSATVAFVRNYANATESRYLVINKGNGDGTFQAPIRLNYPSRTGNDDGGSILAMDFDRDGVIDLLGVDRTASGPNPVYFLKGRGDGTFAPLVRQAISTPFATMRAADFNGDGKIDLLVQEEQQNVVGILLGNGDGTFANTVDIYAFPSGGFSADALSFGDVDGDNDLDVVIGDWGRSKIVVLTNLGNTQFATSIEFPVQLPLSGPGSQGTPSAVVVGDFTGDGKADIGYATYSASVTGGGIGLYVGDGSGTQFTFQATQTERLPYRLQSSYSNPTPIDFDQDGDLDIVLYSNGGSGSQQRGIVVELNDGTGHFTATNYLDSGNGVNQQNGAPNNSVTIGVIPGDFNRDGMIDLLAAESNQVFSSDYSRLSVLLADRPGVLRAPTAMSLEQASFGSVSFLLTGDFNNDGIADVWGAQYQGVSITRLGNGDGTFQKGLTATPYIGNEVLAAGFVADFNNDGNQDVMWIGGGGVQGGPGPRYLVALGNGDGTFQISYANPAVARTARAGDFNHDGFIDFAARGDHNFVIMLNDPAHPGTFTQSVSVPLNPIGEDSAAIDVNDFDGDGNLDIAVVLTDSNTPPHRLQFFHGNGDGTVGAAVTTSILSNTELRFPKWLQSADLNQDGIVDLVMTAAYSRAAVMLGKGDGTFGDPTVYTAGAFFASFGSDLLLRDVNGDGNLDLVNLDDNPGLGRLVIRLGAGDGTFGVQQTYDNIASVSTLASADFDNDGHEDFVLMNLDDYSEAVVFSGSRPGLSSVASVDINGDGNLDVLAINTDNSHVKRLLGNGQGGFIRQSDLLVGPGPVSLATGDFNADGKLDFVTANRSGKSVSIMLAEGDGSYTRSDVQLDAIPIDVQVADLNGDGKLDLAVIDTFQDTLQILLGVGTGVFQSARIIPLGDVPSSLTFSDIDSDGRLDAVIALSQSNRIMILEGQGDAAFSSARYVATSSAVKSVAATDLNQDGRVDIVATLPEEDQVAVFFGIGSNRFAEPQRIHVGAQPNSLVLQDSNGDGRTDILVTNSGDSTASVILNKYDPTKVYHYQAVAVDPDSDPIDYSIASGPGGMIFDATTGEISWAPSADQVGLQKVVLQASDGRGGLATQQFTIAVAPAQDNAAPVFTSQPPSSIAADSSFNYSATAIDNDKDTLRYRIVAGPTGSSIDPVTGAVKWDARSGGLKFNEANNNAGVQIPNSPSLDLSSFTIEGWFSFDATSNQTLIWKDAPLQYPFHGASYALRYQWGNLQALIGNGSSEGEVAASFPWTPTLGQAYHIAGTFDAATGSLKLLLNGSVVAEKTTTKQIFNHNLPLLLGFANQDPFSGTMSNVRVWDAARSSAEIFEGVDREYDSNTPHLIAAYRFTEGDTVSIVDASGHQLNGMFYGSGWPRRVMGIAPVTTADFTVSAEDGRGGIDLQSFQVHIVSRLRGNIAGTVFNDTNGDGLQQSNEAALAGLTVYVDSNGNSQRDSSEVSTTTDADGHYLFTDLVGGNYQVRVQPRVGFLSGAKVNAVVVGQQTATSNLPLVTLPAGQLRGVVLDDQAHVAAHMQVFADLDHDGLLDANEPTSWTDDLGKFALAGLVAGAYSVRVNSRPGWTTTSPTAAAHDVVLGDNATLDGLDFVVAPRSEDNRNQPVIISTPDTVAQARSTYGDFVFAESPSGSNITYSLAAAPVGMVIDPTTGRIVWVPTINQIGSQRVIVRAVDADGAVAMQDFNIEVGAPNSAPIVTSKPANPIATNTLFSYAIDAQDAEQISLKYTMLTGPSGANVDLSSGVLTWTPSATQIGNFDFVIDVSDGVGGNTLHAFTLSVQDALANTTPFSIRSPRSDASLLSKYISRVDGVDATGQRLLTELRSGPAGLTLDASGLIQWLPTASQLGPQTVSVRYHSSSGSTEDHQFTVLVKQVVANSNPTVDSKPELFATVDQLYSYDVVAADRDNDAIAFELLSAPAGMSINPATGTIRWMPASDQRGAATVTIRVQDPQDGSATQTFTLNTLTVGGPPSITSIPPTQAVVGQGYLYSVIANDLEADPLNYTLLQAPVGMTINARTGEIAWNPTVAQIGQQGLIISVSDATGGASTQGFAIQVLAGAPNLPPVIRSEPVLFATVAQLYVYDLSANDPEGAKLTYSLRRNPSGMQIDSETGRISWTPSSTQSGRTVVTVVATDAAGGTALQSFELDVLAANHAPTFVSTPPSSVYAGAEFKYDLVARDEDRDSLSYEIVSGAPSGMTIDVLGRIRWMTSTADIGALAIQVRARDPRGRVATQTINLQVIADNVVPKVTVLPTPGGWPWDGPIVVFVSAVDNVGVTGIELKVNDRIVPLDANHMARLSAEDWGFGALNMVATARDAAGNVGTGSGVSFYRNPDVDYEANPAVPTAIVTSPTVDSSVVGMVRIEGTAGGPDFKQYKLSYARADQLNFTEFAHGTSKVTDGLLGTWDTTLLENDAYVIRLEVTDIIGSTSVVDVPVGLSGSLKLGNFRLSFEDLTIPVAGIPITIVRTYDTLRSDRDGDFGYGWRLEYRNTDLRTSLPKSGLEDIGIYTPFKEGTKVYLTLPGGERQGFTFTPEYRVLPGFGQGNDLVIAFPRFTSDRGVNSTLSAGGGSLIVNEFGEMYTAGGIPWNPASPDTAGYKLTTADGTQYAIDGANGKLTRVTDRAGNSLRFTDFSIESDSGPAITIDRDLKNRIVSVHDIDGAVIQYQYSRSGDLTTVVDREGNKTQITYKTERAHYLDQIVDPLGRPANRLNYDANGRVATTLDANGSTTQISYDPANSLVTTRDPLGAPTTYEYDQFGNVVGITNAIGAVTRSAYDDSNFKVSDTDALGNTTRYDRNSSGKMIRQVQPNGAIRSFEYDLLGNITSQIDETGTSTSATYDQRGNITLLSGIFGLSQSANYSSNSSFSYTVGGNESTVALRNGQLSSVVNSQGRTEQLEYDNNGVVTGIKIASTTQGSIQWQFSNDANGRMVEVTNPLQQKTRRDYDAAGNVIAQTDAMGNQTRYTYDSANRLKTTQYADGQIDSYVYDAAGRKIDETIGGIERRFKLDAIGRVIELLDPDLTPETWDDNPRTKYRYDLANNLISSTDARGFETRYEYDQLGRRTATIDPDGGRTTTTYDLAGRIVAETDASGGTKTYRFENGRLASTKDAIGATTSYVIGDSSARVTDALGNQTTYLYGAGSRLQTVVDAAGNQTSYVYDDFGRLIRVTDALSHSTTYQYDSMNHVTRIEYADSTSKTFEYDSVGRVTKTTEADGTRVENTYDSRGRVTQVKADGVVVSDTTYTAAGNVATVRDSRGTTRFEYDPVGRMTKMLDASGGSISYTYDTTGNLTSVRSPGLLQSYIVDWRGNPTEVDASGLTVRFEYDGLGRVLKSTYSNGIEESRLYDKAGNVTSIDTARNGQSFETISITRDILGRPIQVNDGSELSEYRYNNIGRLEFESYATIGGVHSINYLFDAVGNRLTKSDSQIGVTTYTYDSRDRMLTEQTPQGTTGYRYDQRGSRIEELSADGTVTRTQWDAQGRMVNVGKTIGNTTTSTALRYDDMGNLIGQTVDGKSTEYLVDRNRPYSQILAAYDDTGTEEYVFAGQAGPRIAAHHGIPMFFSRDINNVRLVTDGSGAVVSSAHYDAYGNVLSSTGTPLPFLYNGELRQQSTQLDFLRARYYDPAAGVFLSVDPAAGQLALPQTLHDYAYANLNPVSNNDPSGRAGSLIEQVNVTAVANLLITSVATSVAGGVFQYATGGSVAKGLFFGFILGFGIGVAGVFGAEAGILNGGGKLTQLMEFLSQQYSVLFTTLSANLGAEVAQIAPAQLGIYLSYSSFIGIVGFGVTGLWWAIDGAGNYLHDVSNPN